MPLFFFLPRLYVDHFFSGTSSASQTLLPDTSPLNNSIVMEQFLFPRTAAGRLNDFKFRSAAPSSGLPIHFQTGERQDLEVPQLEPSSLQPRRWSPKQKCTNISKFFVRFMEIHSGKTELVPAVGPDFAEVLGLCVLTSKKEHFVLLAELWGLRG